MKGSLDVCLSARPQRAEEIVCVYCFPSHHTITKKQANTKAAATKVESESQNNISFVYSIEKRFMKGMEMELSFLFSFSNCLEI